MLTESLKIDHVDVKKLLSAASPDGALLYIYLQCGNRLENAEKDLQMNPSRLSCAAATLRQLGLYADDRASRIAPGERPCYSEQDVIKADYDPEFARLKEEVQRLLGKGMVPSERDLNELNDQAEAALQSSNRFIQKAAYNAQGRLWECGEEKSED